MKRSALAVLIALLAGPAMAETVSFKCSFGDGKMDAEVLYVVNSTTKDVSVMGAFGTHSAKLLNDTGNFLFCSGAERRSISLNKLSISPVVKPQSQFVRHWGCFGRSSTKVSPKATGLQGMLSAL